MKQREYNIYNAKDGLAESSLLRVGYLGKGGQARKL